MASSKAGGFVHYTLLLFDNILSNDNFKTKVLWSLSFLLNQNIIFIFEPDSWNDTQNIITFDLKLNLDNSP